MKTLEEYKKYVNKVSNNIENLLKDNEEGLSFYQLLVNTFNQVCEERNNLEQALDENKKLQQENKQLKEIIQKAINRISLIRMDNDTSIESHKLLNDVLNILRGKEDK